MPSMSLSTTETSRCIEAPGCFDRHHFTMQCFNHASLEGLETLFSSMSETNENGNGITKWNASYMEIPLYGVGLKYMAPARSVSSSKNSNSFFKKNIKKKI